MWRMGDFEVVVGAGTLRSADDAAVGFPHRWTEGGVTVQSAFTGAHLLHLAVAGCVLNDVYREAVRLGLQVHGVRVRADGDFDTTTWASTGISYAIEVDSPEPAGDIDALLTTVEEVAEIPRSVRSGGVVKRLV
jgi:uncharacterized OsmC-like protein